jgi:hypothetical protein
MSGGRGISAAQETALLDGTVRQVALVELEFSSGTTRNHTGVGTITWNGNDYQGLGNLGSMGAIEEANDLQAQGFTLTLSGVNPANVALALGEQYQGRAARVYIALLDANHQLIGEPIGPFRGRMDTMDAEIGQEAKLTLTIYSRLADWERARIRRYNNADQQAQFPGDKGMEFVEQMVEKELVWGRG